MLTTEKLDEIGAELETFLRQEKGVYRQREFQQNGCISDRTEQLWFTNRVTLIVKQERILSTGTATSFGAWWRNRRHIRSVTQRSSVLSQTVCEISEKYISLFRPRSGIT